MLANLPQLLDYVNDGLAWLVKGIRLDTGACLIAAVVFAILWLATMRHNRMEPPRCSDGE